MEPRLSKESEIEKILALHTDTSNWEVFIRTACEKGIAALTYHSLKSRQLTNQFAQKAFEKLKISYLAILAKNSYYWQELKKILAAFIESGIAVIPLKGITLSWRLYGDITSRDESVDFDLLVREPDKEPARRILEGLGYEYQITETVPDWQWCYTFTKPQAKMIELHWDITMMGRSRQRINGLWEGAEPVEREGVNYYDFKPEELLLYLSAHLTNSDSFRTLRAACDIRRVIEKYIDEIDWQQLAKKAQHWRLSNSLYAALILEQDLFGNNFPGEILSLIRPGLLKRAFIRTFANQKVILREGTRRKILDKFLSYTFFELIEATSLKDYLTVFKRILFPPKSSFSSKSYILRFGKGIAKLLQS